MSVQGYLCINQTSDASLLAIILSTTVSCKHIHTQTYNGHSCTPGHPSPHSWPPFSVIMVTFLTNLHSKF